MPFRLPADQMRRLERAAKYSRQSRQAFVEAAVMTQVAEVEERRRLNGRGAGFGDEPQQRTIETATPTGLGIASAIRAKLETDESSQPPAPPQGQVVVNVGASAGAAPSVDAIDRLAAYVATGSEFERDTRLRTAVDVLRASAASEEERKVLAARLDEAIAARTKASVAGVGTGGGVLRTARVAYDKIADLLKGV